MEAWRRWKERDDPAARSYYSVTRGQRTFASVAYLVLAALLTLAMGVTFTERDL
jgi:hypothetical protein